MSLNLYILTISYFVIVNSFSPKRKFDAIVFKGEDLPQLLDVPVNYIVGFTYSKDSWTQIPIQIDEMHLQNWETIKNGEDCR